MTTSGTDGRASASPADTGACPAGMPGCPDTHPHKHCDHCQSQTTEADTTDCAYCRAAYDEWERERLAQWEKEERHRQEMADGGW